MPRIVICSLFLFCFLVTGSVALASVVPTVLAPTQDLSEAYNRLWQTFQEEGLALAKQCEARNDLAAEEEIRSALTPLQMVDLMTFELPEQCEPELPTQLTVNERLWRPQWNQIRRKLAGQLAKLVQKQLHKKNYAQAYLWAHEVLRQYPDHQETRRLLGYVLYENHWVTPFVAQKRRSGFVDHPEFGWLPKTDVSRYENGERRYRSNWVSASKEAELRRDFKNAWRIETDHFIVRTNAGLEMGVQLGRKLELFHRYLLPTLAPFFDHPKKSFRLFDGQMPVQAKRYQKYEVHFFRSRKEYIERLKKQIPNIRLTNGLYYMDTRTSYFFHNPKENRDDTLFHEATHQILFESRLDNQSTILQRHFWISEGIASYMESFIINETGIEVGDPRYLRFYRGRYWMLEESVSVPFAELAQLGMTDFQRGKTTEELQQVYAQSALLTHFLMHYENGLYRQALTKHLSQLYNLSPSSKKTVQSLPELTGVPYAQLDEQFQEYARQLHKKHGHTVIMRENGVKHLLD